MVALANVERMMLSDASISFVTFVVGPHGARRPVSFCMINLRSGQDFLSGHRHKEKGLGAVRCHGANHPFMTSERGSKQ